MCILYNMQNNQILLIITLTSLFILEMNILISVVKLFRDLRMKILANNLFLSLSKDLQNIGKK